MATAAAPLLETTVYTASSTQDALGRVLTAISPDGSEVAYTYNQRGALKTVTCKHRGAATATSVVADIAYDVRGRRESISHAANATTTTYAYDPQNFRLRAIETTRASDNKTLQALRYHYDPVGNITDIRDESQQTVYFQNTVVEAANSYSYDALYRLVEATGREHATQGTAQRSSTQLVPDSSALPKANDPNALRRYTQRYSYDAVGNLETVVHTPSSGTGWTRRYQYRTDGNRLVATSAPGDAAGPLYSNTATYSHAYPHDAHGNFSSMPHMAAMDWDELDQLHHCTVGSQEVYFQYAGGQRVRKYVVHAGGTTEERVYLGSVELYCKRVNGVLEEEWESLHISDDSGRIVLVETHTVDDGTAVVSPAGIWRFQLSNHLGSATTEVTETGAVISHEEYHPYGTSAYRLQNSQLEVPAKRYRFTGMERDEETGLGHHTARYYAPWLGRWTAADPIGIGDGINRFDYVSGHPLQLVDHSGGTGVTPADEHSREAILHNDSGEVILTGDGSAPAYTYIAFDDAPLLTGSERAQSRPRSLPVGRARSEDYNEIADIQAPVLPDRAGVLYPNDPEFAGLDLSVRGANPEGLVVDQIKERAAYNREWSGEKLVQRMNDSRGMAMSFMGIYLGSAVVIATGFEVVAVSAPIVFAEGGAGLSARLGVAALESSTHITTATSAWAEGEFLANLAIVSREAYLEADAIATGSPVESSPLSRGTSVERQLGSGTGRRHPDGWNAGHKYAKEISPGGTGRAFAGHGELRPNSKKSHCPRRNHHHLLRGARKNNLRPSRSPC